MRDYLNFATKLLSMSLSEIKENRDYNFSEDHYEVLDIAIQLLADFYDGVANSSKIAAREVAAVKDTMDKELHVVRCKEMALRSLVQNMQRTLIRSDLTQVDKIDRCLEMIDNGSKEGYV